MLGRALGVDVTVVCNETITADKRRFIDFFGGRLVINDFGSFTYDGNRKCRAMLEQPAGHTYCFLDQLHNWDNPRAHEIGTRVFQKSCATCLTVGVSLGRWALDGTMAGAAAQFKGVRQMRLCRGLLLTRLAVPGSRGL